MIFKKGDKVKFLNENDYGTITRVMDNGIVMVLNSDDFEVPAKTSELILDPDKAQDKEVAADYSQVKVQMKPEAKKTVNNNQTVTPKNDDYGIYLGFVPADRKALDQCDLDLYFVNDSDFRICYNFMRPNKDNTLFTSVSGVLEPDSKEYVETIARKDLGDLTYFKFQFLYAKDGLHKVKQPEEFDVKLHAPKFYQSNSYKVNDFFDEDAVIIPVKQSSEMIEATKNLSAADLFKNKADSGNIVKKTFKKTADKQVVDLHLTELLEDESGMSPKEKLDYQMKVFREKMDEFIKDPHVKKAVFIHGKGNGTLKLEIRRCLDHNYKRYEYQDASFEEYGGGATLVYVK
ncbi:MAG: DUF2027 domain-containing protein [Bacteroidales bacterium]|jgi:hypothetical protein|nr:DUF2027 domain-containing protein [Bacteroidales bacterium]